MIKNLNIFFSDYGLNCDELDLNKEIQVFKQEMMDGYQKDSSLKMIDTHINFQEKVTDDSTAIVIDAGGTNLRIALVEFKENNSAKTIYLKKFPMIGLEKEVTANEFFEKLFFYLEPILKKSNKIGFCFSFPTEITPERDGIVIEMNKGVKIAGIEGIRIGQRLKDEIKFRGFGINYDVTVINDTVSCLLGGMIIDPIKQYDSFIGFILGTGTNTAFVEPIKENRIINIESGGYDKISSNWLDKMLDKKTDNPTKQKFEKMISGAYLGTLASILLQKAGEDQYFTYTFTQALSELAELTTEDISLFMDYPYSNYNRIGKLVNSEGSDDDRMVIFEIIDQLLLRSAKLVAINILGIMDYLDLGHSPVLPICISSEGSTFFKFKRLNSKILDEINHYSTEKRDYYCEFVEAKESTIFGTAIAALLE